ncbi:hypothetical protein AVEN_196264-1 [Araneus ventricosus]|uniref:Uncharacterized protein n=1 Tax=Araneus ventricosus TaxID=182803 RepID=A0A4Y2HYV7_ARAVE|nr:hypothetical protein AVEN_196264-1 [Araneus ventricosus]
MNASLTKIYASSLPVSSASIAHYLAVHEALRKRVKEPDPRYKLAPATRAKYIEEARDAVEKIELLQEQVSSIGICPVVNCAVHASNISRSNPKRPLSNSEENLNSDNDDPNSKSFKLPSYLLKLKILLLKKVK